MTQINFMSDTTEAVYTRGMADNHEYLYMAFGDAVRFLRRRLKMRQGELAERLSVTQGAVSQWEKQREPLSDPFTLYELATALQTTPDDLREGRVRVGGRERTMGDYIDEVAAVEAPEGVDQDRLRELLQLATELPDDALDALVEFAEWQAARKPRGSERRRRKVSGDTSGDTDATNGE